MTVSKHACPVRTAGLLGTALVGLMFVGADARTAGAQPTSYTFTTLDYPSNTGGTFARGINDSGEIVGYYNAGGVNQPFVYSGGNWTTFQAQGKADDDGVYFSPNTTVALGINNAGYIVGYETAGILSWQFIYNGGTNYTDYVYYFSSYFTNTNGNLVPGTIGSGLNNEGQVVGTTLFTTGSNPSSGTYGYEQTYALEASAGSNEQGFIESTGGTAVAILQFPQSEAGSNAVTLTQATGVNDEGEVVGYFIGSDITQPNSNSAHGFIYTNGEYLHFDEPGTANSNNGTFAEGINNADVIVGYYLDQDAISHGFVFNASPGTYTTVDVTGATNTFIFGVNNAGDIVGAYVDSRGQTHGFEGVPSTERPIACFTSGAPVALGQLLQDTSSTRPPVTSTPLP